MLLELAPEWSLDIDRGPDWLFIRLSPPNHEPAHSEHIEAPLAERVGKEVGEGFSYRVVVERGGNEYLPSWVIGGVVGPHKRVTTNGGMLRLCGVSKNAETVLRISRLSDRFPAYRNRTD